MITVRAVPGASCFYFTVGALDSNRVAHGWLSARWLLECACGCINARVAAYCSRLDGMAVYRCAWPPCRLLECARGCGVARMLVTVRAWLRGCAHGLGSAREAAGVRAWLQVLRAWFRQCVRGCRSARVAAGSRAWSWQCA